MGPTLIHQINGVAMGTAAFFSLTSIDFVSTMYVPYLFCYNVTTTSNTKLFTYSIGLDNEYSNDTFMHMIKYVNEVICMLFWSDLACKYHASLAISTMLIRLLVL